MRLAVWVSMMTTATIVQAQNAEVQSPSDASETMLPAIQVSGMQEASSYRVQQAITATKTDTPLAEIPQSITVVTAKQITDQGATNLQDALTYAAGVRSDAYGLDSRTDSVLIRGANPTTFVDGMRQTNGFYTSSARPDPYLFERIEVLRGPSSMLFGQGSTAGVVNLVSKRPLETFQADVDMSLGNFNRKQVQADVTGALTEDKQWRYRLIALTRRADTQVDDVQDDRDLVAPSLMWAPNQATTLTLLAARQWDRSGSTSQFFPWAGTILPNVNGAIPTHRFIGEPSDRYDTKRTSLGWLFEHRLHDDVTIRQNARYSRNRVDYFTHYANAFSPDPSTGFPGGWSIDPVNQRQMMRIAYGNVANARILTLDQHFQAWVQTGIVAHTVLAGLDYTRYRLDSAVANGANAIDVFDPVYGNPVLLSPAARPRNQQRQLGAYVQDQMKIAGNWIVVVGLRQDRVNNATAGSNPEESQATTRRFGVMYQTQSAWSPYVNYSESFTPQAGMDFYGNRYRPVEGGQIEAGIKYMPADSRHQLTASVYRMKEKNRLAPDPANPLNSIQTGQAKSRGVELEYKAQLMRNIDLLAHYNYTRPDQQLTAVARHQAAVWGVSRFSLGHITGLSFGMGVRYMSSFRDSDIAPRIPALQLLDAVLAWDQPDWRFALNIRNITDKRYYATCLSRGDCWIGARRTMIFTASRQF